MLCFAMRMGRPLENPPEMAARHVREQAARIRKQGALITRLAKAGLSTEQAEEFLRDMHQTLEVMKEDLAALQTSVPAKKPKP
jgi:hypothetical protein